MAKYIIYGNDDFDFMVVKKRSLYINFVPFYLVFVPLLTYFYITKESVILLFIFTFGLFLPSVLTFKRFEKTFSKMFKSFHPICVIESDNKINAIFIFNRSKFFADWADKNKERLKINSDGCPLVRYLKHPSIYFLS